MEENERVLKTDELLDEMYLELENLKAMSEQIGQSASAVKLIAEYSEDLTKKMKVLTSHNENIQNTIQSSLKLITDEIHEVGENNIINQKLLEDLFGKQNVLQDSLMELKKRINLYSLFALNFFGIVFIGMVIIALGIFLR